MKNYHYALLTLFCIGISACGKDSSSNTSPAPSQKTTYLTQKSWVMIDQRDNVDNGTWTDSYASVSSCLRDNILSFSANGTCVYDLGAIKCSGETSQTSSGTWAFTNNETRLTITGINGSGDFILQQLDDNTLVIVKETITGGHDYKSEGTYKHP